MLTFGIFWKHYMTGLVEVMKDPLHRVLTDTGICQNILIGQAWKSPCFDPSLMVVDVQG